MNKLSELDKKMMNAMSNMLTDKIYKSLFEASCERLANHKDVIRATMSFAISVQVMNMMCDEKIMPAQDISIVIEKYMIIFGDAPDGNTTEIASNVFQKIKKFVSEIKGE